MKHETRLIRCLNKDDRGKVCGHIFKATVNLGGGVRCPQCRRKVYVTEYNSCLADSKTAIDISQTVKDKLRTIHGNTKGSFILKRNKFRNKR